MFLLPVLIAIIGLINPPPPTFINR